MKRTSQITSSGYLDDLFRKNGFILRFVGAATRGLSPRNLRPFTQAVADTGALSIVWHVAILVLY
jgi:hypothetical protein